MFSDELIKIYIGIVGAVIGFLVKDYLDRRREIENQRIIDRREHYRNLLLCLKSLSEGKREHSDVLKYEYAFLWLYAPDNVIQPAKKLINRLDTHSKTINVLQEVGELLLEIRKDLGFRHTKLSTLDFNFSKE